MRARKKRKTQEDLGEAAGPVGFNTPQEIGERSRTSRVDHGGGSTGVPPGKEEALDIVERRSESIEAKGKSSLGLANPAKTTEQRIAGYLRDLSMEDALALKTLMVQEGKFSYKVQATPEDIQKLQTLVGQPMLDTGRDGAWYLNIVTCKIWDTKQSGSDHPRWQVKMTGSGFDTRKARIKQVLSKSAWETLLATFPVTFKPAVHHIAYNADPRREAAPLPLNVGAGGSVSHPCDERGCIAHLESTPVHGDNMDKQRCKGITLICFKGFIIQEVPCAHGECATPLVGEELFEAKILASCRKVRLLELGGDAVNAVLSLSV